MLNVSPNAGTEPAGRSFRFSRARQIHYHLQLGCYFSQVYATQEAEFTYCDLVDDFIWNHAYLTAPARRGSELLSEVTKFYISRERRPCVYVQSIPREAPLIAALNDHGFKQLDSEAWMVHEGPWISDRANTALSVRQVGSEADIIEFRDILAQCFPADYGTAVLREYRQYQAHKSVCHLLGTFHSAPVAIGSLYQSGEYAIIHNMATAPDFRNQGIATAIMCALVKRAADVGITMLFLQCLGHSAVEEFYSRLGFRTRVRRLGFVLEGGSPSEDHVGGP